MRALVRLARALAWLLAAALVALAGALAWLTTDAGNRWLLDRLLPLVAPAQGTLTVERLQTRLLDGVTLTGVAVADADGHLLLAAERVQVAWALGGLVGRRLLVHDAQVAGLTIDGVAADGCRDLLAPWDDGRDAPSAPWTGIGLDLDVRALRVEAASVELCAGGTVVRGGPATLAGALAIVGPTVSWSGASLRGALAEPLAGAVVVDADGSWDGRAVVLAPARVTLVHPDGPTSTLTARGRVALDGPGALALTLAGSLDPAGLGVADLRGPLGLDGTLDGPFAAPSLALDLVTPGGPARLVAGIDTAGARLGWHATLDTPGLALGAVVPAAGDLPLRGRVEVAGSGTGWPDDLDATATVALTADRLPLGGHAPGPVGVEGRLVLADGVVGLGELVATAPGMRGRVTGTVDVPGGGFALEVLSLDAGLGALAAWGAPELGGAARFRGRVAGRFTDPVDARIVGRLTAPTFTLPDTLAVADADAEVDLRLGGAGLDGVVRLDTGAVTVAGRTAEAGAATVRIEGDRLVVDRLSLVAGAREVVGLVGTVDLARGEVEATAVHLSPMAGADWIADRPLRLRYDDEGLSGIDVALSSARSSVTLAGAYRYDGGLDLRLDLARFDLAGLDTLPDAGLVGWTGRASGAVSVAGRLGAPAVDGELRVEGLGIPEVIRGADVVVRARGPGDRVDLDAHLSGPAGELATLTASVPLREQDGLPALDPQAPVSIDLQLLPRPAGAWDEVLAASPLPVARASAAARLGGTLAAPTLSVVASGLARVGEPGEWMGFDLDAASAGDRLALRAGFQERLARRADLVGSVAFDLPAVVAGLAGTGPPVDWERPEALVGDLSADLVPLQLPVQALSPFVAVPTDLGGALVGGLHLSGHPFAPRVEGALILVDARVGELAVSPAMLTVAGAEGGYTVAVQLGFGADGDLSVAGFLPFPADAFTDLDGALSTPGLDLELGGSGVPLAALAPFVPDLADPSGRLVLSGRLTGTLADPEPDIRLTLDDGAFSLLSTNTRYAAVRLHAQARRGRVALEELSAETASLSRLGLGAGRSALRGRGHVDLDGLVPGAVEGTLELDGAWLVDRPDQALRLSGVMAASGTWDHPELIGHLAVVEGRWVVPERFFYDTGALELDPDITVIRRDRAAKVATAADEGLLPWLDADVVVALDRNLDLDASMPTEDLGGSVTAALSTLRLEATLGDVDGLAVGLHDGGLSIVGQVEPIRGSATVLGKDFRIDGGVISFTGLDYAEPLMDVRATHANSTYGDVTATIGGTPSDPEIALANADWPGEDDAVAILLFGAPVSQMGSSTGAESANLVALALSTLASQQVESVGELTRLDVFDLSADGVRGGKRLGDRVLMIVGANFGDPTDVNLVELTLEVQLPQRWFMEVRTGTSGFTDFAAYRRWRF